MNKFKLVLLLLLAAYTGSYCYFSLNGSYHVTGMSLNGVKVSKRFSAWAPQGFMEGSGYTGFLPRFYLPLLAIDRKYWHGDKSEDLTAKDG